MSAKRKELFYFIKIYCNIELMLEEDLQKLIFCYCKGARCNQSQNGGVYKYNPRNINCPNPMMKIILTKKGMCQPHVSRVFSKIL